jgi:hypothetical protein
MACCLKFRHRQGFRLYGRVPVSYKELNLVLPSVSSIVSRAFRSVCFGSAAVGLLLVTGVAARLAAAEPPNIYLIERLSTNQVTLHFNTEANRTYTLQYLDNSKCPTNSGGPCSISQVPTGSWSNLWVAPRLPFPDHFVITDYRTNRMRLYRLKVTP